MLLAWMAVLQPPWLHIYRIYGTCYLVNGSSNQALIGIPCRELTESSCFNAFSRVDMRVEVKIPGGVKTHAIDERGAKYVFLCGIV
jgi:hypothetical protein